MEEQNEAEAAKTSPSGLYRAIRHFFDFVLIGASLILLVICIGVVDGRERLVQQTGESLTEINESLAATADGLAATEGKDRAQIQLNLRRQCLTEARTLARKAIDLGADSRCTSSTRIYSALYNLCGNDAVLSKLYGGGIEALAPEAYYASTVDEYICAGADITNESAFEQRASPHTYSTAVLAFFVVIVSALLGAAVSSLRRFDNVTVRSILLGMAAGYTAMLVVRGGRALLVNQTSFEGYPLNIYGLAFAGLIVGMFTERAYELLSEVIASLEGRIRAASGVNGAGNAASNGTSPAPAPNQKPLSPPRDA